MMTSGFDAWRLGLRIAETMVASQAVIGARMALLGAGFGDPRRIPFVEFSRLVPEKVRAFEKAGTGAARALGSPRRGAGHSLTEAAMSDGSLLFDWWERSLAATGAWWAPLHSQATANARRLT